MKPLVFMIDKLSPPGGAQRLVIDDLNALLKRGVDVRLITLRKENSETSLGADCSISAEHWTKLHFRSFLDFCSWRILLKTLRTIGPEAVITHLWFTNVIGRIAALMIGTKKIVAFEHNVYDTVKSRKQFLFDRFLSHYTTKIVAVSEAVRQSLLRNGIAPERIVVLRNAIDVDRFSRLNKETVRKKLKLPPDEFIFLFAGRLTRQKGTDILLQAFEGMKHGTLLIAGDGEDRVELMEQAKKLKISDRVHFLGIRHDLPDLYGAADVFVLPSRWEGLVIVVIEAMASGLPIIASNVEGMSELIKEGRNGNLIPAEDVVALKDAMEKMYNDPHLRNSMRGNNITDSKKFDINTHAEGLLSLLNSAPPKL